MIGFMGKIREKSVNGKYKTLYIRIELMLFI